MVALEAVVYIINCKYIIRILQLYKQCLTSVPLASLQAYWMNQLMTSSEEMVADTFATGSEALKLQVASICTRFEASTRFSRLSACSCIHHSDCEHIIWDWNRNKPEHPLKLAGPNWLH